jgi:serine protease Do
MKYAIPFACFLVLMAATGPAALAAPQGNAPFVFYGEEPWGGSYLGVDTEDVTSERLSALHLKEERGVEVTMVDQDAPAGKAGIKEHDVILSVNDQQVESVEQLRRLIREVPPGRTVSVGISRDGQPMTLHAQLTERSKAADMNFRFNPVIHAPDIHVPDIRMPQINIGDIDMPTVVVVHAPRSSGMMIENLTPQLGEFFGVKGNNGVLVRSVEKGSRAQQAGIRAGDVIVKINGSTVNDCSDFSRLLRSGAANKATVSVMRDHKEQTLTLSLPEAKRTGSLDLEDCESMAGEAACAAINKSRAEIAALMPEITADLKPIQPDLEKIKKEVADEMQRQKPAIEKMKKQVQEQVLSDQGKWKKEMEQIQKDMQKQKGEIKKQMQEFRKHNAEI